MSPLNSAINVTTFWASIGIVASAVGGLFTMQLSHTSANGHSSLAEQSEVSDVKIKIERIETEVRHNKEILNDLKTDIRHIKKEQDDFNKEVLEVIRGD
jgi:hypothetical protein